MPRSGCSALHGVNPNQKKKQKKLQVTLNFCEKLHILDRSNIIKSPMLNLNNSKIRYKDTTSMFYFLRRSENMNFPDPGNAQKLLTPLR